MSKIYKSMLDLVGNTPLLEPVRYNAAAGLDGVILLVKLDAFNPQARLKTVLPKP